MESNNDSMKTYRGMLSEAVMRSKEWGLEDWSTVLADSVLGETVPVEDLVCRDEAFWRFTEQMSRSLPMPPELRANRCGPVHLEVAANLMRMGLPNAPFLTIGDVLWDGDSCFNVSEASLREALEEGPDATTRIGIHAWLTFPDMAVLDFTFPPWQCRQNGEAMNLGEFGALTLFGDPEALREHYDYRPMLVGPQFLWRTGVVTPLGRQMFDSVQAEWVRRFVNFEKGA
jgi:hypothetical protein